MAYKLLKSKIDKKQYESKESVQEMLDVFVIGERISTAQYKQLTDLLASQ